MKIFSKIFVIFFIMYGCSLNPNSKIWTTTTKIAEDKNLKTKYITSKKEILNKELNVGLKIDIKDYLIGKEKQTNLTNNIYSKNELKLKKKSKYNYSKIKQFDQYEPEVSFINQDIIFFDNKGSILKFSKNSKLLWKKNYYTKTEIKNSPILFFSNNSKVLVVADTLGKVYSLNLKTGNLLWSNKNNSPFNSEIKILNDKFYLADSQNSIHCFSLKDGKKIWKFNTDKPLIKSQKKLSLVIKDEKVIFNNSIGDITAIDNQDGKLLWQTPTQSSKVYTEAMFLKTSDLVLEKNYLIFSNNTNNFFSIDIEQGAINWKQNINSYLRPVSLNDLILTITNEGYFVIIDNNGNIIRSTYLLKDIKKKKRSKIKFTGFIAGGNKIYLSSTNGRLFVINISTGKVDDILKIDNEKISRPSIYNDSLYIVKDNSVIKLN